MISETSLSQHDSVGKTSSLSFFSQFHPDIQNEDYWGKITPLSVAKRNIKTNNPLSEEADKQEVQRRLQEFKDLYSKAHEESFQPTLLPLWNGSQELIAEIEQTINNWNGNYPVQNIDEARLRFEQLQILRKKEAKIPSYHAFKTKEIHPVPNPFTVKLIGVMADLYVMGLKDPKIQLLIEEDKKKFLDREKAERMNISEGNERLVNPKLIFDILESDDQSGSIDKSNSELNEGEVVILFPQQQ